MRYSPLSQLPQPPLDKTDWPWTQPETAAYPIHQEPDQEQWPLITVVTPSYQQGKFIEETIRSVLLQDYPNLEYIIIDGGSTDETIDILNQYSAHISYWVSEPDRGQGHALNKGWSRANGSILGWLNSDDLYLPGTLKTIAKSFLDEPHLELVTGGVSGRTIDLIEYRQKPPQNFDLEYYLWFSHMGPGQPGIFLTSDLYRQVGAIDEQLYYTLDREYWMRISQLQPDLTYLKLSNTLAIAREYEGNKSSSDSLEILFERVTLLDRVYARPNLTPRVKRLKASVYSALYHNIANQLVDKNQPKNAAKYVLKAIQYKPTLVLKTPTIIPLLVQLLLQHMRE